VERALVRLTPPLNEIVPHYFTPTVIVNHLEGETPQRKDGCTPYFLKVAWINVLVYHGLGQRKAPWNANKGG
jgi:hypothetical protein